MNAPKYLHERIVEVRHTEPPRYGMTRSGYTKRSGAPTDTLIRLEGESRWRRVMVWQFSNMGTRFVRINGEPHIIPTGVDLDRLDMSRSATRPRSTRKAIAVRAHKKRKEAHRRKRVVPAYFTVIVPWSDRPTAWHPTTKSFSPLSRGSFKTKDDARRWADEKLRGQPYAIKRI